MSTNYYAHIHPGSNVILVLHIGKKWSAGGGKTRFGFNGQWFPSWTAWKTFLTHNQTKITIYDECNTMVTLPDLIQIIESCVTLPDDDHAAHQYGPDESQEWISEGYSFLNSEFF